jgi:hypothetical protein
LVFVAALGDLERDVHAGELQDPSYLRLQVMQDHGLAVSVGFVVDRDERTDAGVESMKTTSRRSIRNVLVNGLNACSPARRSRLAVARSMSPAAVRKETPAVTSRSSRSAEPRVGGGRGGIERSSGHGQGPIH